jgi:Alginate export
MPATTSATTQAPTDGRAAVTREGKWAAVALDRRRAALMTAVTRRVLFISSIVSAVLMPAGVRAQDPQAGVEEKQQERTTGLPTAMKWTFNFDAGWGTFGFANSLFDNPKEPGVEENLSDQWFEGFVKPALLGAYTLASSSELYGKLSAVGERTYGSVPAAFGEDVSSFGPEDLYVGWRSGKSLAIGENALDFVIGRSQYRLGHGFLLFDGAAEGGSRGGYWTNARKAFELAAIGRFKPGAHTVEAFYLDKDELEESDSGSRLWGANYEYSIGETTLGATYMKWLADVELEPGRDGLNVFNVRAYTAPIPSTPDLSFEFEYASERNSAALASNAWTLQGAYQLSDVAWKPKLSYRYAFFQGDDPDTASNEAFDPLFPGFYDWGTWWQGEIAGEYFLSNSNLKSHLVRMDVSPSDALGGGLLFFKFSFDQPQSVGPDVTDADAALEIDSYVDWKLNANFTVSVVGAYADPGKAVQQATGRTKNLAYGMVYSAIAFEKQVSGLEIRGVVFARLEIPDPT